MIGNIFLVIGSLGLLCYFFLLARNHKVYNFRVRMLHEESGLLDKRISAHKYYDGHRRFDDLPSYGRMFWEVWKPLASYEKPLSNYYD